MKPCTYDSLNYPREMNLPPMLEIPVPAQPQGLPSPVFLMPVVFRYGYFHPQAKTPPLQESIS